MKRRLLLIGSICCSHYFSPGQPLDSARFPVKKTDVEFLYNQYLQDGNNSAVTGGIGTEQLAVFGPSLKVSHQQGKHTIGTTIGSDIISSASTDRIDYVMSSASSHDARTHAQASYAYQLGASETRINVGVGASIESDYFSFHQAAGVTHTSKDNMRSYSAQLQVFQDDLRWGRLDWGEWRPQKLIFPSELRTQQWYETYRRRSYLLNLGYTQVLDRRNVLGLFLLVGRQDGLLATPFHRVYFSDSTLSVEQLPDLRNKASLSLKWNRFVGGNTIVKSNLDGYADSFGVLALAAEVETAFKLSPQWTLRPGVRLYTQQSSDHYAPYREHALDATFYTSDPDLSGFQSIQVGVGGDFRPYRPWGERGTFQGISLRYRYYYRSNGLHAHVMSLSVRVSRKGREK